MLKGIAKAKTGMVECRKYGMFGIAALYHYTMTL